MVRLTKIYTRGGDQGETSLGDGTRLAKHALRVEAIGAVDEANAMIGFARLDAAPDIDALLSRIQNDMFDLGADLGMPSDPKEFEPLRIVEGQVIWLEERIDEFNAALAPLESFILPAGSATTTRLHLARTVVRRAERVTSHLAETEKVGGAALRYLNRLSDLLFVLARHAANRGADDVLWVPGKHR